MEQIIRIKNIEHTTFETQIKPIRQKNKGKFKKFPL